MDRNIAAANTAGSSCPLQTKVRPCQCSTVDFIKQATLPPALEDAKKAFQKHDRNGLVHTIWTVITPFANVLCNCTASDCLEFKNRLRLGLRQFFKAEYVAIIDWESCNGCRDCMKLCNFGAISYSVYVDKCSINQLQCYGCGVCRALCPRDAITLLDRNAIPALRNEW